MQGEFKHIQTDQEQSSCEPVETLGKYNRMDVLIAKFIAGEEDEQCLISEAEFALWTSDTKLRAWGLLASSLYYKFDSAKSNEYLKLTCDEEQSSDACEIAKSISENIFELGNKKSMTAKILHIKELSNHGDYANALRKMEELSNFKMGFANFIQKQTIKFLWSQQKKEQALGAFVASWPSLSAQDRVEIAGWFCLQQVDEKCDNQDYLACDKLKNEVRVANYNKLNLDAAVALVKENNCKNENLLTLNLYNEDYAEDPQFQDLINAIDRNSGWDYSKRIFSLQKIVNEKNNLSKYAAVALLQNSKDEGEILQLKQMLKTSEKHDYQWAKLNLLLEKKSQLRKPASKEQ